MHDDEPITQQYCHQQHEYIMNEIRQIKQSTWVYKALVGTVIGLLGVLVIVGVFILEKAVAADEHAANAVAEVASHKALQDQKLETMHDELGRMDSKLDKLVDTLVHKK